MGWWGWVGSKDSWQHRSTAFIRIRLAFGFWQGCGLQIIHNIRTADQDWSLVADVWKSGSERWGRLIASQHRFASCLVWQLVASSLHPVNHLDKLYMKIWLGGPMHCNALGRAADSLAKAWKLQQWASAIQSVGEWVSFNCMTSSGDLSSEFPEMRKTRRKIPRCPFPIQLLSTHSWHIVLLSQECHLKSNQHCWFCKSAIFRVDFCDKSQRTFICQVTWVLWHEKSKEENGVERVFCDCMYYLYIYVQAMIVCMSVLCMFVCMHNENQT